MRTECAATLFECWPVYGSRLSTTSAIDSTAAIVWSRICTARFRASCKPASGASITSATHACVAETSASTYPAAYIAAVSFQSTAAASSHTWTGLRPLIIATASTTSVVVVTYMAAAAAIAATNAPAPSASAPVVSTPR